MITFFFLKQFDFTKVHSSHHAYNEIIHYSIYDSFNQIKYALGVLIVLSKAFDTVDHNILVEKLN